MNTYKTYCLTVIIFLAFIAVASGNEGFVQDTIPKQRPGNVQDDKTTKEQARVKGIIKSVPRARKQAKPNIVKPNIDIIKTVSPIIKPKIKAPVRVKVNI